MIDVRYLLIWIGAWLMVWAIGTLVGAVLLFLSHSNDGVYRSMRIHGLMVFTFLTLTAIINFANVPLNPELRYILSVARAVIVPLATASFFYVAYEVWRARQ